MCMGFNRFAPDLQQQSGIIFTPELKNNLFQIVVVNVHSKHGLNINTVLNITYKTIKKPP